ncbi:hypothetical protein Tco_1442127 [Tanacetum coccineum]
MNDGNEEISGITGEAKDIVGISSVRVKNSVGERRSEMDGTRITIRVYNGSGRYNPGWRVPLFRLTNPRGLNPP